MKLTTTTTNYNNMNMNMNMNMNKLFYKKTHHNPSFYKKHYKLLLWLSLSLYLFYFTSSSSSKKLSLTKTTLKSSSSSTPNPRALIEQNPSSHLQPVIKIFVYNLPSNYNKDWLSNPRCGTHLFAAEVAIHEALLTSEQRTLNPFEADFFFVPVYVSCNFSTVNGFPALSHARALISSSIHHVSANFPFWNRSLGRDHIFVASHDYGACFHAMEDVAIADGIPEILRRSILLQTFGVKGRHRCQEADHVLIPPYIPPEILRWPSPETVKRDIFVFFRGKMEVNPKNVSGRYYSKKVRTEIWNRYKINKKFYLKRKRYTGYQSEIARSVFCLCPLGWAPWSPRLVESVALGCIPVIIADGIRLPFANAVNWPDISLTVAEKDVKNLESLLDHVAATNLTVIQRNLWDPAVRKVLIFSRQNEEGDATWQVIKALERKKRNQLVSGTWEE